jgi:UDP-glucuronate decarboxylase
MDITLRLMTVEDVPFYNKIRNECREYLHDQSYYTLEQSISWYENYKPKFLIAAINGVDVGYFRTSIVKGETYVGLDISHEYRGKGYAVPLYDEFLKFIFAEGSISTGALARGRVLLRVRSSNGRAIHLYEKVGFVKLIEAYNKDINDMDIIMMYTNPNKKVDIVERCVHNIVSSIPVEVLNEYRDNAIFITGSSGFIGKWLSCIFSILNTIYDINIRVVRLDCFNTTSDDQYCDITAINDLKKRVDEELKYATVKKVRFFNCAGIANPSSYMERPMATLDVSYIGTKNIIQIAQKLKVPVSIMLFSSSEIYGNPDTVPTPEDYVGAIRTDGNRSCYDVGKLVLETIGNIYMKRIPMKIIRPFNFYGPLMVDTRIIPEMIRKYINGKDLYVYGDGNQTRSFCYVVDAMKYLLMLASDRIPGGTYNVGNPDEEISMITVANKINSLSNESVTITTGGYPDNYPSDEPMRRCPDMTKTDNAIKAISGEVIRTSLDDGLEETYNYNKNKFQ